MSDYSSKGPAWDKTRAIVLRNSDGLCVNCGNDATHVDHIIPKVLGGTDELSNLQAMCAKCNTKKGARLQGDRVTWLHPAWFAGNTSR